MTEITSTRSLNRVAEDARTLAALTEAPEILRVVNVWDPVSTRVISELPGTRAIATAGHSIAASHGYADGEQIPLDLMIAAIARIVAATDHPVTADLDGGYGNAGETARRAMGVGVSGANIEDQLRPLEESAALVADVVAAGEQEGVAFALNARTDAFVRGGDRPLDEIIADAIARGRAYLDAGATSIFVPGILNAEVTRALVDGIGDRKISVIGLPGALSAAEYERLGVARISYGPMPQNVALTALKRLGTSLLADGSIPDDTEQLNNF
ncbi:isocitrate lyase/phosphoenolpyruvate mutase family protein [Leucobacter rhizosphaerae]|uniref:Isocitrate lyase/phosphoenolpyruvate mutase family protein n=1 Tax=Leucobacter rhizosphaerae TaxID=2932245 RepID=A0ABY4FXE9_9MICO|nr:isocitrate lyase/phosphoenolpyruvate mutase family protein [Leucobacter rhizosphaerae]UOQ60973.1 isocitrate lyase/phosphoenolpyruvate mutase family protein [Leucobacter rhizosphaerae]